MEFLIDLFLLETANPIFRATTGPLCQKNANVRWKH